jgi:hypothetical protein
VNNIILSVYLTQRDDPQSKWDPRPARWKPDSDSVVRGWIQSVRRLNLDGFIFHDGLSEEFIDRWEGESDRVVFIGPVEWKTNWSSLEERVVIYRDFLLEHRRSFDFVLTTDLFDVEFLADPFKVMTDPTQIYVGSEPHLIGHSIVGDWMRAAYGQVYFADRPTLNCGIVGGQADRLLLFLERWLEEMNQTVKPAPLPIDMTAFNRLIYREKIPYVTGQPLHTNFKKYENAGAAIRHK